MTPSALSIVTTTFPEGAERNKALGIWVARRHRRDRGLADRRAADRPRLALDLPDHVPVGIAALALAPRLLRESRAAVQRRGFDPAGALSVTAALTLLVYAVVEAPENGWGDARTIGLLAGSAALFVVFTAIELRVAAPLVPLRILRSRTLVGANALMLVFSGIGYGLPFVLTLYAQQVLGYSPLEFGLSSIVFPIGVTVGAIAGQALIGKAGLRPVATTGLALLTASGLYLAQVSADGSYLGDILIGLLLAGPGVGLVFVTCSIAALAGVGERDAGLASGLNNTRLPDRRRDRHRDRLDRRGLAHRRARPAALTEGLQAAFGACVVFALVGLVFAWMLGRRAPAGGGEPVPQPAGE